MERIPITIHGSRCLVIGFGRIGKLLSLRLRALGARVTVSARKPEDAALIRALDMQSEVTGPFARGLDCYDLIVNTVPAPVLGQTELSRIRPDCLILDLASKPGGVDQGAAENLGRQVIHALSLPGRVAPATAGYLIRDTILDYLRARYLL